MHYLPEQPIFLKDVSAVPLGGPFHVDLPFRLLETAERDYKCAVHDIEFSLCGGLGFFYNHLIYFQCIIDDIRKLICDNPEQAAEFRITHFDSAWVLSSGILDHQWLLHVTGLSDPSDFQATPLLESDDDRPSLERMTRHVVDPDGQCFAVQFLQFALCGTCVNAQVAGALSTK